MGRTKEQLLVRIEQGGAVVQRRLAKKGSLSIGRHPGCDVIVYGEQFPKKHILFSGKNSHFQMILADYIKGEVIAGDSRLSFKDLLSHNLLPVKGDKYFYPVTLGKKGVLVVGDAKIIFQCAEESALPPQRRPPKFIGFSWGYATLKELGRDLPFKAVLLVLVVLSSLLMRYMNALPDIVPAPRARNVVPERLARIIVKQPDKPVVRERIGTAASDTEDKTEPDAARKKQTAKNTKPQRPESQGILGLLTGTGSSGNSSGLADFLLDKGLVKELDEVMSATELRVGNAKGNQDDDFENLIAASDLGGIDDILGDLDDVEAVSLGEKGQIKVDRISGMRGSERALGSRTEESVRSVLLNYTGRLTYIYNKYLKRDPKLKGKMVVEVVVAASGRVASARLVSSSMGNAEFEREVLSFIRRWQYEAIDEGEVTVTYPLFFNKA